MLFCVFALLFYVPHDFCRVIGQMPPGLPLLLFLFCLIYFSYFLFRKGVWDLSVLFLGVWDLSILILWVWDLSVLSVWVRAFRHRSSGV